MKVARIKSLASGLTALLLTLAPLTLAPLALAPLANAQDTASVTPKALTFQNWKDQQILEAQNQVLRASMRLQQIKTGKTKVKESTELPAGSRLKRMAESETLTAAEQDLKRAQDIQSDANQLKFENYVEVYISNLRDQPEALQKLSEKLSKDELAEILKYLMRKSNSTGAAGTAGDAQRNNLLIGGLMSSTPNHTH